MQRENKEASSEWSTNNKCSHAGEGGIEYYLFHNFQGDKSFLQQNTALINSLFAEIQMAVQYLPIQKVSSHHSQRSYSMLEVTNEMVFLTAPPYYSLRPKLTVTLAQKNCPKIIHFRNSRLNMLTVSNDTLNIKEVLVLFNTAQFSKSIFNWGNLVNHTFFYNCG